MSSEIENIFSKTTCPSQDSLLQYVRGMLSVKDKREIEKHLTDCEMCSDEIEGLLLLKKPEAIESIELELDSKIDILIKKEKKGDYGFFFKIAATVVMVLGLSTVIYFQISKKEEKTNVAANVNDDKKAEVKKLAIIDTTKIYKGGELLIDGKNRAENKRKEEEFTFKTQEESQIPKAKPTGPIGGIISPTTTLGYFSNNDVVDALADETTAKIVTKTEVDDKNAKLDVDVAGKSAGDGRKEEMAVAQDQKVQQDLPVVAEKMPERDLEQNEVALISTKKGSKDNQKKESAKNKESVTKAVAPAYEAIGGTASTTATGAATVSDGETDKNILLQNIIEKVNSNQYSEALALLETYPQQSNNDETALFYKGLCYYKLNNPKKASAILKELEKNKSLALYNDIQWYYALSLLSLNKKNDASKVLKDIINNKSPYAPKAQEELDKIK